MESNPIVKWVRKQVGARVNFIRLDIATPAGKAVMRRLHIPLNSAYLIFDARGKEVWRSFAIPLNGRKAVRLLMELSQG
ncbi:MAG: hypothetical protein D6743_06975 [Calditrichaeota bacterium]|nr:MAG: hypothetical protein D6743_06975 [Calditrichota bacterium]